MAARKFDLLVCCFPGGYSYTNKAVTEHGDYKKVAFIDHYGHLRLDVPADYIPADILLKIEHDADTISARFIKEWDSLHDITKFERLLDMCPLASWVKMPRSWDRKTSIDFLEYAVFGWCVHSLELAEFISDNNITPRKW